MSANPFQELLIVPIPTPLEAAWAFLTAWIAGDVDGAMQWFAADGIYALYISGELLPYGGVTYGKENFAAALRSFRRNFEYVLYRPMHMTVDGDVVRTQVEFMYRHFRSGELLSGRFRLVMSFQDGKMVRADEYHDRAKVEAFMRLFTGPGGQPA